MAIGPFEGKSPFSITDIDPNDLLRAYGDLSPALFHGMITQGRGPIEIAWDVVTNKKGQQGQIGTTFKDFNNRLGDGQGLPEEEMNDYTRVVLNGGNPGDVASAQMGSTVNNVERVQLAYDREEKSRSFAAAANKRFPELGMMDLDIFIKDYPERAEQLRISLEEVGLTFNDIKGYLETHQKEALGTGYEPPGPPPSDGEDPTEEFFKTTEAAAAAATDPYADPDVVGYQSYDPKIQETELEKLRGILYQPEEEQSLADLQKVQYSLESGFESENEAEEDERSKYVQNNSLPPIVMLSPKEQFMMIAGSKMGAQMSRPGMRQQLAAYHDIAFGGFVLDNIVPRDYRATPDPTTVEYPYQYYMRGFTESPTEFHSDKVKETRNNSMAKLIEMGKSMEDLSGYSYFDRKIAHNNAMQIAAVKTNANITGIGIHGKLEEAGFNSMLNRYREERGLGKTKLGIAAWFAQKGPRFNVRPAA